MMVMLIIGLSDLLVWPIKCRLFLTPVKPIPTRDSSTSKAQQWDSSRTSKAQQQHKHSTAETSAQHQAQHHHKCLSIAQAQALKHSTSKAQQWDSSTSKPQQQHKQHKHSTAVQHKQSTAVGQIGWCPFYTAAINTGDIKRQYRI